MLLIQMLNCQESKTAVLSKYRALRINLCQIYGYIKLSEITEQVYLKLCVHFSSCSYTKTMSSQKPNAMAFPLLRRENQKCALNIHGNTVCWFSQSSKVSRSSGSIFLFSVTDAYPHYLSLSLHFRLLKGERGTHRLIREPSNRARVFTNFNASWNWSWSYLWPSQPPHRQSLYRRSMVFMLLVLIALDKIRTASRCIRWREKESGERQRRERGREKEIRWRWPASGASWARV